MSLSTPEEVVDSHHSKPIVLKQVDIVGGDEFSSTFFTNALYPLLFSKDITLGQLVNSSNQSYNNLLYSNAFKKVKFQFEESAGSSTPQNTTIEPPIEIIAKLLLEPYKLQSFSLASVHTEAGHAFKLGYRNLNAFGNAESFKISSLIDLKFGNPYAKTIELQYMAPIVSQSLKLFFESVISDSSASWASHKQSTANGVVGLTKTLSFDLFSSKFTSYFTTGVSMVKRSVLDINDSASDTVKTDAGDSFKESFIFSGAVDSRTYLPSSFGGLAMNGLLLQVDNEISGLSSPQSEKYLKSVLNLQLLKSFRNFFTLDLSSSFGAVSNLTTGITGVPHFHDKFFLGAHSLKGFAANSVGLRDGQDFVGGNIFYRLSASLFTRFFFAPADSPLRFYLSVNSGDVYNNFKDISYQDLAFIKGSAISSSVGAVYRVGDDAAFDLHYNLPVSSRPKDVAKPGLEFSLAINGTF
ncbi:unnamed protein product [Kuraishia capsulata CBS 1993]|uniref:Bacterial surface antigen (D15) domain-containing protein n=1 Tax=Kuraishia capsulata CBS 1993 TaxID=1382522 RepID=W6MPX5_9ASCO|nr:uncharacterized protein KUCA_T00003235001 [Kuraishia capsulata CBS 1993]CDK27257.1 unnamed protein product [Kuraishia capsulata CBS 1993]